MTRAADFGIDWDWAARYVWRTMSLIHITRDRQPLGQFPLPEVRAGLATGRFLASDLAWREGMGEWVPLSELPDLLAPAQDAAPADPAIPPAELIPPQKEPAWERREDLGVVSAAIESVRQVLTQPTATFGRMPREGGFGGPLTFNILLAWIGSGAAMVYQAIWTLVNPDAMQELEGLSMGMFWVLMLVAFILLPLFFVFTAFVGAGITHVFLWLVGAARRPYETTFRVLCYAHGATSILQLIPICGGAVYAVWNLFASVIGLARAHETEVWRVVAAVLLSVLLCCAAIVGLGMAVAGLILGGGAAAIEAIEHSLE